MSGDPTERVRSRYLDLLERSILNSIYGESRLEMALQGADAARRGCLALAGPFDDWP